MRIKDFSKYNISEADKGSTDVPFADEVAGNHFRKWVNTYFPDYAKSKKLDPQGSFNNSHVKKAWEKYGGIYKKLTNGLSAKNAETIIKTNLNGMLTTENLNKVTSLVNKYVKDNLLPKTLLTHKYSKHLYVEIDWWPDIDFGYFNLNTTIKLISANFKFNTQTSFTAKAQVNVSSRVPDGFFGGLGETIKIYPTLKGSFSIWTAGEKVYCKITPSSLNIDTNWIDCGIGELAIKNNSIKWYGETPVYNFGPYTVKTLKPLSMINNATSNKFKSITLDINPVELMQTYAAKIA